MLCIIDSLSIVGETRFLDSKISFTSPAFRIMPCKPGQFLKFLQLFIQLVVISLTFMFSIIEKTENLPTLYSILHITSNPIFDSTFYIFVISVDPAIWCYHGFVRYLLFRREVWLLVSYPTVGSVTRWPVTLVGPRCRRWASHSYFGPAAPAPALRTSPLIRHNTCNFAQPLDP